MQLMQKIWGYYMQRMLEYALKDILSELDSLVKEII